MLLLLRAPPACVRIAVHVRPLPFAPIALPHHGSTQLEAFESMLEAYEAPKSAARRSQLVPRTLSRGLRRIVPVSLPFGNGGSSGAGTP